MTIKKQNLDNFIQEGESHYFNGEINVAYEVFLRCEEIALELGDPEWIAETIKNVGRVLHRIGKYQEAKEKYLKAIMILDELNLISKKPTYLNHLANVYQFTNEFKKQYDSLQEALILSMELGDNYTIAKVNNSLGVFYEIFGDYKRALDYMQKAYEYFLSINKENTLIKTLNLLSSVKIKLGYYDNALNDAYKVYTISRKNNDNYNLAHSLRNIISAYYDQGDLESCLEYFEELLEIQEKLENVKTRCDILRVIGLVYQEFNEIENAFKSFSESLQISKEIIYYHGIAKGNEHLGDLLYKTSEYLESYRYYSNSLKNFQEIFNSIKDPYLKDLYRKTFERLPDIINKVDTILNERPFELPGNELEDFSNEAISLCKQVQEQDFEELISKECSDNVKQLNRNARTEFRKRDEIKKDWYEIISENCFTKLDKETQDNLIRYKLNEERIPDDYESIIQKISKAVECEIRVKLFEGYYYYWNTNVKIQLKELDNKITDRTFEIDYSNLKNFLEDKKFLELKPLYFILSTVFYRKYINRVPQAFSLPFEKFREYIGLNNLHILERIIKFFDKKYKCGKKYHYFIDIRNKCSHGGGRFQEKRIKKEISIGSDTLEEILSCLIDQDIKLLVNFCSLDL